MLRYYGVDVMVFFDGSMSERRLWGLIHHLPPESATMCAIMGTDPGVRWSQTDYLIANLTDAVRQLTWVTGVQAAGKEFNDNPLGDDPPEPVYRPVEPPEPDIPETPLSDMAAWIAQIGSVPNGG